jgi:hypothetical protein
MNARKYSVFVRVNAIAPGRRSRTRDAIAAVRHLFLDADHDDQRLSPASKRAETYQTELPLHQVERR